MIKVHITGDGFDYYASPEEQKTIDDLVNATLKPIELDCMTYNASVTAKRTLPGNYKIEPECDQYSTLYRMKELLPQVIPSFQ